MGKSDFSHPEGYRQQDQVQGASEVALVLPDVPEAVPGRGSEGAGGPARTPRRLSGGTPLGMQAEVPDAAATPACLPPRGGAAQGEPKTPLSRAAPFSPRPGGEAALDTSFLPSLITLKGIKNKAVITLKGIK